MELNDIYIIRVRWDATSPWTYEICSEKDYDRYEDTKAAFSLCPDIGDGFYQQLQNIQMEVVYKGKIVIGKDLQESLGITYED